jgi:hypothetical protein
VLDPAEPWSKDNGTRTVFFNRLAQRKQDLASPPAVSLFARKKARFSVPAQLPERATRSRGQGWRERADRQGLALRSVSTAASQFSCRAHVRAAAAGE